jgi:hypothetical protein
LTSAPTHTNPLDLSDADFLARARDMCATKAAYTTRAEAVAFAKRRDYAVSAYLCPWCHHWHHTSYDRARSKAFNRRLRRLLRADDDNSDLTP